METQEQNTISSLYEQRALRYARQTRNATVTIAVIITIITVLAIMGVTAELIAVHQAASTQSQTLCQQIPALNC